MPIKSGQITKYVEAGRTNMRVVVVKRGQRVEGPE